MYACGTPLVLRVPLGKPYDWRCRVLVQSGSYIRSQLVAHLPMFVCTGVGGPTSSGGGGGVAGRERAQEWPSPRCRERCHQLVNAIHIPFGLVGLADEDVLRLGRAGNRDRQQGSELFRDRVATPLGKIAGR